jgi:hypothetical protein
MNHCQRFHRNVERQTSKDEQQYFLRIIIELMNQGNQAAREKVMPEKVYCVDRHLHIDFLKKNFDSLFYHKKKRNKHCYHLILM